MLMKRSSIPRRSPSAAQARSSPPTRRSLDKQMPYAPAAHAAEASRARTPVARRRKFSIFPSTADGHSPLNTTTGDASSFRATDAMTGHSRLAERCGAMAAFPGADISTDALSKTLQVGRARGLMPFHGRQGRLVAQGASPPRGAPPLQCQEEPKLPSARSNRKHVHLEEHRQNTVIACRLQHDK